MLFFLEKVFDLFFVSIFNSKEFKKTVIKMGEFLGQPLTTDKMLDVCAYWDEEAKYNRKGMYVFNQSKGVILVGLKFNLIYYMYIFVLYFGHVSNSSQGQ